MKLKWSACGIVAVVWGFILMTPSLSIARSLRLEKVDYKENGQDMWIQSDHAWKTGYPQIEGIISSRENVSGPTYIHVYFFDSEKQSIGELKKVACTKCIGKEGDETGFDAPNKLPRRTEMQFMFEVPKSLVDKKWDRAIVVFGTETEAAAEATPRVNVEEYDFPEKELVLKSK